MHPTEGFVSSERRRWAFLEPWLQVLRPCLRLGARGSVGSSPGSSHGHGFGGIVVELREMMILEDCRKDWRRLRFIREAVELVGMTLRLDGSPATWMALIGYERGDLRAQLASFAAEELDAFFRIDLRGYSHSKHNGTADPQRPTRYLAEFLAFPPPSSTDTAFGIARQRIMALTGTPTAETMSLRVPITIKIRPPAAVLVERATAYKVTPTQEMLREIFSDIKGAITGAQVARSQQRTWMEITSLELALDDFDVPPDVLSLLKDCLDLRIGLSVLRLQLGPAWDTFELAKLVDVINAGPKSFVKHLGLIATTHDTYDGILQEAARLRNVDSLELVDRVWIGDPRRAFVRNAPFMLCRSTSSWSVRSLVLDGVHFEEKDVECILATIRSRQSGDTSWVRDSGSQPLESLTVTLRQRDRSGFTQILQECGASITALSISLRESDTRCELDTAAIMSACPALRDLEIRGFDVKTLDGIVTRHDTSRGVQSRLKSLRLANADLSTRSIQHLARVLTNPRGTSLERLQILSIHSSKRLSSFTFGLFETVLVRNLRLEYLRLCDPWSSGSSYGHLATHHLELLPTRRRAFLSSILAKPQDTPHMATSFDPLIISTIMGFGACSTRRIVEVN